MHNLKVPLNYLPTKEIKATGIITVEGVWRNKKTSYLSLAHCDTKAENVVSSDGSEYGIGAVIL